VQAALAQGARVECGGRRPTFADAKLNCGNFYLPTVLSNVPLQGSPFDEEIFGPVVPLMRFTTEKEAVDAANSTR